jgi:putative membrane protein
LGDCLGASDTDSIAAGMNVPRPASEPARSHRLPQALFAGYAVVWVVTAINPRYPQDWLLENLLVFLTVPVFVVTYRRFQFSNPAYVLLTAFFVLHAYGAHYTYAETPAGDWVRDTFGHNRNHYDRLVHFMFGLLASPAMWELLRRVTGLRPGWAYVVTVHVMLAWSGLYEIIEAVVAMIVSPELGAAYNGTQGDEWDAQKDSALAAAGSVLAMVLLAVRRRSAEDR